MRVIEILHALQIALLSSLSNYESGVLIDLEKRHLVSRMCQKLDVFRNE